MGNGRQMKITVPYRRDHDCASLSKDHCILLSHSDEVLIVTCIVVKHTKFGHECSYGSEMFFLKLPSYICGGCKRKQSLNEERVYIYGSA